MSLHITDEPHRISPSHVSNGNVNTLQKDTSSNKPLPPFIPDDKPSDRLLKILFDLGICNENGDIKKKYKYLPITQLNIEEIQRIINWLNENFQLSDKAKNWFKDLPIHQMLNAIKNEIEDKCSTSVKSLELAGSTVVYLIGITYFQRAFKELGFEKADSFITIENFPLFLKKPSDYDMRFFVPKAKIGQLLDFREVTINAVGSLARKDPGIIFKEALANWAVIRDKEKQNYFSVVSFGDRSDRTLECIHIIQFARKRLFSLNALSLRLNGILAKKPHLPLCCDYKNQWQTLADILTENVDDEQPESIDELGFIMFISHITRGKISRRSGFNQILFENFLNQLSPKKPQQEQSTTQKLSPKKPQEELIADLLYKCATNHHHNDGVSLICLVFNAGFILNKFDPTLAIKVIQTAVAGISKANPLLLNEDVKIPNSSEKILVAIFRILFKDPQAIVVIEALLQLLAFSALSHSLEDQNFFEQKFFIRNHNGSPVVEIQLLGTPNGDSIMVPMALDSAIGILEKHADMLKREEFHVLMNELLCASFLKDKRKASTVTTSPILKYLPYLTLNWDFLFQKTIAGLNTTNTILHQIYYTALTACIKVHKLNFLGKEFLKQIPLAIHYAPSKALGMQHFHTAETFFPSIAPALHGPFSHHIHSEHTDLKTLCSTWVNGLTSCEKKYSQLAASFLKQYFQHLSNEDQLEATKQFIHSICSLSPIDAVSLLNSLFELNNIPWAYFWDALFQIFSESNKDSQMHSIVLHHIISSTAKLINRFKDQTGIDKELTKAHLFPLLSQLINLVDPTVENLLVILTNKLTTKNPLVQSLWINYCSASLSQNLSSAVDSWQKAESLQVWPNTYWPRLRQELLADITLAILTSSTPYPKSLRDRFFILCLDHVITESRKEQMKTIVSLCTNEITNSEENIEKIKSNYSRISLFLNPEQNFNLLAKLLSDENDITLINRAANLLIANNCDKLFFNDSDRYLQAMLKILDPVLNQGSSQHIVSLKLLEKIIPYVGETSVVPSTKNTIVRQLTRFLQTSSLSSLNGMQELIQEHIASLISSLESKTISPCMLQFVKALRTQDIKINPQNYSLSSCLGEIAKYLTSPTITLEEVLEANTFLNNILLLDEAFLESHTFEISLIEGLLKFKRNGQACKHIETLLNRVYSHPLLDITLSDKVFQWIQRLDKIAECKSCFQFFDLIKEHEPSKMDQLSLEMIAFIEEVLDQGRPMILCAALLDHSELLLKQEERAKAAALKIISRLIENQNVGADRLKMAIRTLKAYSIVDPSLWQKTLKLCSESNEESLLKDSWEIYSSLPKLFISIYEKEIAASANCWCYGLKIVSKVNSEEFYAWFNESPDVSRAIPTRDHKVQFYNHLFNIVLDLRDAPTKIKCLRLLHEQLIIPFLCANLKGTEGFFIALRFVKALSLSDNYDDFLTVIIVFSETFTRMARNNYFPDEAFDTMVWIFKRSENFVGSKNLIDFLQICLRQYVFFPNFDIFALMPSIIEHEHPFLITEAFHIAYNMIVDNSFKRRISNEEKKNFYHLILSHLKTYHLHGTEKSMELYPVIHKLLYHEQISKYVSEELLFFTRISLSIQSFLKCKTTAYYQFNVKVFKDFIAVLPLLYNQNKNSETENLIKRSLTIATEAIFDSMSRFRDVLLFGEILASLMSKLSDSSIDPARTIGYNEVIFDVILSLPAEEDEDDIGYISGFISLGLHQLIQDFPKHNKAIFSIFHKFLFFKRAYKKEFVRIHFENCNRIFLEMAAANFFTKHISKELIQSIDIILHYTPPNLLSVSSAKMLEVIANTIDDLCSINSPVAYWHAITCLERISTNSIKIDNSTPVIGCFIRLVRTLHDCKIDKFFNEGDVPIHALLFNTLMKFPNVTRENKSISEQDLCISFITNFIEYLKALQSDDQNPMPAHLSPNYEPFPFIVNSLFIAFNNGFFTGRHSAYLQLIQSLREISQNYLQKNPNAKYHNFIKNMMINAKSKNGAPLTAEEIALRDQLLQDW